MGISMDWDAENCEAFAASAAEKLMSRRFAASNAAR
jgi:hypothetical protein